MKTVVECRMLNPLRYLNTNEGDANRAAENKRKTWVPSAENVEKALYTNGIEHSRHRQSKTENGTGA